MSAPLDRAELIEHLVADAAWIGVAEADGQGISRALEWLWICWGAGESHLSLALVHDLGHLLLRGRSVLFTSGRDLARWPAHEQAARLAYEDGVLGRWLRDPSVDAAHLALAGVAPGDRDAAIAHAICLALAEPLRRADALVEGNAAFLRSGRNAALERLAQDVVIDPDWSAFVAEQRQHALAQLTDERVYQPADLWELAHFSAVPSESSRLALRQLHEMRDAVPAPDGGLLGHVKRRAQEVPVEDDTAAEFPAGGFDGISQKGRFENLVRTEIGYVEADVLPGVADAFDIRYVLGELLYYTRDESPLLDAHREVTVRIDQPDRMRDKIAALPLQTLVMIEGLALALHRDLCQIFGRHAVTLHLRWSCHDTADRAVAQEELGLVGISLAEDLAHGRASAEITAPESDDGQAIVFSMRAAPSRRGRRTTWVRVEGATWTISPPGGDPRPVALDDAGGIRALVDALLFAAVGVAS